MLNILNSFRIGMYTAFIEMRQHKLRSFLSMLGVLLGVAALVAMLSLIGGIDVFLSEKMGKWAGAMWIFSSHHPASQEDEIAWSRSPGLRLSDADTLDQGATGVKDVYRKIERGGGWGGNQVTVLGQALRGVRVNGITPASFGQDSAALRVSMGRLFTDDEYRDGSKVCLVSWKVFDEVAHRLDGPGKDTTDFVGTDVVFRNARFKVVGLLRPKDKDFQPWNLQWSISVPIKALQLHVTGFNPDPGSISLTVSDPTQFDKEALGIVHTMTALHRGVMDFQYRGADWAENLIKMMSNISLVMGGISIVSLLVGGMGIMNVMLSSISERIKEIGVRKALGAQKLQIFVQFIAETTTLSLTGGTVGACIGLLPLAFGEAIKKSTQGTIMPTIMPQHALLVFGVIVFVGLVFGLYPAVKASRMDPVDALRYE